MNLLMEMILFNNKQELIRKIHFFIIVYLYKIKYDYYYLTKSECLI